MISENFIHNAQLQDVLKELEVRRKEIAGNQRTAFIIYGVLALGMFLCYQFNFFLDVMIIATVIFFIIATFIYFSTYSKEQQYRSDFKSLVIAKALKTADESINYHPEMGIAEREFEDTQLFSRSSDRYDSEDLVTGKLGKTSFYFAEVHAEYKTQTKTKNGTTTHWHDIFKGILFVADFNKNFNRTTIIRPKNFLSTIGSWLSFNDMETIELENVQFDKTFSTYGTDQVEARYLLTPAMMERILKLDERSEDTISLAFFNTRLYIAFPIQRNCFEAPTFKTLLDPACLDQDIQVINSMLAIISELDLNTRIWTKA